MNSTSIDLCNNVAGGQVRSASERSGSVWETLVTMLSGLVDRGA